MGALLVDPLVSFGAFVVPGNGLPSLPQLAGELSRPPVQADRGDSNSETQDADGPRRQ